MAELNLATATDLFFEFAEDASNVNGFVLKPISASEAFRRYNWLFSSPALNKSGNLRGMVINKTARKIYTFSSDTSSFKNSLKSAGPWLALVGAIAEVSGEWTRAKQVWHSDKSGAEKGSRILMLGSAAILRSVTSVVPTAVELGALSVKGYGDLYTMITGSQAGSNFGQSAQKFASEVRTIHNQQWDGENWYDIVEATLDTLP